MNFRHEREPGSARSTGFIWEVTETDFTIEATNTDGGKVRIGTGCANTIYMGYFVTQIVTEHLYPEYQVLRIPEIQPPVGISDSRLIQDLPGRAEKS